MSEETWLRLAYADETLVTQVDGLSAEEATGPVEGNTTSSATLPSPVVRMLELAQIGDGDKVLEIGTGTGYSTALLAHRVGDKNVTSIEVDPTVADRAGRRLASAGFTPTLITGDGLAGYEPNAEYDRLIATCSVRYIPQAWMWQVRDGGSMTVTLAGWLPAYAAVHVTLDDAGCASGHFLPEPISYLIARPHDRPPRPTFVLREGHARQTAVNPILLAEWTPRFVAQLAAPSAELLGTGDNVTLLDVATGSIAWTRRTGDTWTVRQTGPLRLWDAVESSLETWREAGSPPVHDFGLTVQADGAQRVWLGQPNGPSWALPC